MQKNETTAVESIELQLLKRVERPDILLSIARDAQTNRIFCGSSDARVYELDLEADEPQPAFPELSTAIVATGTPCGIWTIDKNESIPLRAVMPTGTPITGSVVDAATIPGKCAAPPAPAIITLSPRPAAFCANDCIFAGVR